ncbi:MAG TPA: sporulation integral membrane protein YtvI [Halanaerobiales bacterium]|nr:sporulation integral membrane protein YtvI [Halanaerobiales bacterium]
MEKLMEKWIKGLLIILVELALLMLLMKFFFYYFTPFIIGAVLASLINPLVNYFENTLGFKRSKAVLLLMCFILILLLLFFLSGVSYIYLELNSLVRQLPDYQTIDKQLQWLLSRNLRLQEFINSLEISESLRKTLNENLELLYNGIKNGLLIISNGLLDLLGRLPRVLSIFFLSLIATFFISRDIDLINRFILGIFPRKMRKRIFNLEKELANSAVKFVRAELILILITGIICTTGLLLYGNPYALTIGIATALLDLIPLIGPALIFIPWVIINFLLGFTGESFQLLILYTIMAAVRQGLEAKVMGNNLGIHPLAMMIALYTGYKLLGALGFIIGPSVLVIVRISYQIGLLPMDFQNRE